MQQRKHPSAGFTAAFIFVPDVRMGICRERKSLKLSFNGCDDDISGGEGFNYFSATVIFSKSRYWTCKSVDLLLSVPI